VNTASKIAKESTITFTGLVYGNINRYLYTAMLARWVGAEFLGIYSMANAIMLISEVLGKMGLETGIMRFVSRMNPKSDSEKIQKLIASSLKMTTIFSLVIMVGLILSSGFIVDGILNEPPLLTSVIIVFAVAIPFNKTLVTQFLNPTILLGSMVICFWFVSIESAVMAPMLITGIVGFFVMVVVLKRVSGVSNDQIIKAKFDSTLLKFSYPLMFVTILQTFMHWMDILMLGYFTDATTVGLYHPAARTAGLLQALLLSFISIYAPMASQFHAKGERGELADTYKLVSRWLLICAIPISAIFIIFPGKVLLLFGPEYLPSAKILVILTGATFIQALLGAAGPTLSMSGHTKLVLWNTIGAFTLNFGLNIFLIPKYGIIGAAMATLISLTAVGLARTIEVGFILKMNFFDRKVIKPIIAGIVVFVGLFFIKDFIMHFHTLVTLCIAGIFSIGSFGLIMWLLKIEEEDLDFFKGLNALKGRK
jgi:O-antigen/teichoic acid export membrane protein